MGAHLDLTVALLESDDDVRNGATGRGQEWQKSEQTGYSMVNLPSLTVTRREHRHHVLKPGSLRRMIPPASILVGGWDSPAFWQIARWGRVHGSRVVAFYESTLRSQGHSTGPVARARARFFNRADAVVVPGAAAGSAVAQMGVEPSRIWEGFNAVDVNFIHRQTSALRSAADFHGTGHRFLYLGQLIERKNVAVAIAAFAEIAEHHDTLDIIGNGTHQPELSSQVESLGPLAERIRICKAVPYSDLPEVLASHDTLLLPSVEEVWGLVVNEALAAGLHVVVSDACGVCESVSDMTGVFVASPDKAAFASAMSDSKSNWSGPIAQPAILNYGPERFAQVFMGALRR